MNALNTTVDASVAAETKALWVSSITRDGLVTIPATLIEQASGSTTIRAETQHRFERGADVVLSCAHPNNDQRLGRILAIEGRTLRITLAERPAEP